MPSILRRANENQLSEWRVIFEGLWRWVVGEPNVRYNERFSRYEVKFPLTLTQDEQARQLAENGSPPPGMQQSFKTSYVTGLSLGYVKQGQYQTTKLVDFLAACLGSQQGKKFREWVANGGGPPRCEENGLDDDIANIEAWLRWFEGLEVYGSIRHEVDKQNPDQIWARFGGPMPVGALPGQTDAEYQAIGRGKLRAMMAEATVDNTPKATMPQQQAIPVPAAVEAPRPTQQRYKEIFGDDDTDDSEAAF